MFCLILLVRAATRNAWTAAIGGGTMWTGAASPSRVASTLCSAPRQPADRSGVASGATMAIYHRGRGLSRYRRPHLAALERLSNVASASATERYLRTVLRSPWSVLRRQAVQRRPQCSDTCTLQALSVRLRDVGRNGRVRRGDVDDGLVSPRSSETRRRSGWPAARRDRGNGARSCASRSRVISRYQPAANGTLASLSF
jgi:hypothetical protein